MEKELGRKLEEAHSDKAKIAIRTAIRCLIAFVVVLAGVRSSPPGIPVSFMAGFLAFLLAAGATAYVFWPLTHLKDYVEFYEEGICYCGRKWTLEELGKIHFCEEKRNTSFYSDIFLDSEKRRFLFTYIKDGKKQFNRAYQQLY